MPRGNDMYLIYRIAYRIGLSVGTLIIADPTSAQYVNNVCGAGPGTCIVNPAPVGSQCGCYTPYGPTPGQIIPPMGGELGPQQLQQLPSASDVCRTFRGVCQAYQAPVGSACNCYGDAGFIIPK
jgi:hypothetical protein